MSIENPLWGAPRIHGELLKLAIDCQSVAQNQHEHPLDSCKGWTAAGLHRPI
jgi:hypothetical protein